MNYLRPIAWISLVVSLPSCGLPDRQYASALQVAASGLTDASIVGSWVDVWGLGSHMDSTLYEHKLDFKKGGTGTHRFTVFEEGKMEHTNEAPMTWAKAGSGRFTAHLEPAGGMMWGRIKGELALNSVGNQLIDTNSKHVFARAGSPAAAQEYASGQQQIQEDHNVLTSILTLGLGAAAGAAIGNAAINNPDATQAILQGATKAALNSAIQGNSSVPNGGGEKRYDMRYQLPGGVWAEAKNITYAEAMQLRKAADDIHVPGYQAYGPMVPTQEPNPPPYVPYKYGR